MSVLFIHPIEGADNMITETIEIKDPLYGQLMSAKSFSQFIKIFKASPLNTSVICEFPIELFINIIEKMIACHYNQYFSKKSLQGFFRLSSSIAQRKKSFTQHTITLVPTNEDDDTCYAVLEGKALIIGTTDELSLWGMLNKLILALHSEKSKEDTAISLLATYLSTFSLSRMRYKNAEVEDKMLAAIAAKNNAKKELEKLNEDLEATEEALLIARAKVAEADYHSENIGREISKQTLVMEKQQRDIEQSQALCDEKQATISKLEQNSDTLTQQILVSEHKYQALKEHHDELYAHIKEIVTIDDEYFKHIMQRAEVIHQQLESLEASVQQKLNDLMAQNENMDSADETMRSILQALLHQSLFLLNDHMAQIAVLQQQSTDLYQLLKQRNQHPLIAQVRKELGLVTEEGPQILASNQQRAETFRKNVLRCLQSLSLPIPENELNKAYQEIITGQYARNMSRLARASVRIKDSVSGLTTQNQALKEALTVLAQREKKSLAYAAKIECDRRQLSRALAEVKVQITEVEAHISKIKKRIKRAERQLDDLGKRLYDIHLSVNELTGSASGATKREYSLRVLFSINKAVAQQVLRAAVEAVSHYLQHEALNKFYMSSSHVKENRFMRLAQGLSNGGYDIESMSTVDDFMKMYHDLRKICCENRSMFSVVKKHLAQTSSSMMFDADIDRALKQQVESFPAGIGGLADREKSIMKKQQQRENDLSDLQTELQYLEEQSVARRQNLNQVQSQGVTADSTQHFFHSPSEPITSATRTPSMAASMHTV